MLGDDFVQRVEPRAFRMFEGAAAELMGEPIEGLFGDALHEHRAHALTTRVEVASSDDGEEH
jgi:hypothetical protein